MNFKSDNYFGVHPSIFDAMIAVNSGAAGAYGHDTYSAALRSDLSAVFEHDVIVYLVSTGTVANCLAVSVLCPPWGILFCSQDSHMAQDECTAPGLFTGGAKIVSGNSSPSKIDLDLVRREFARAKGNPPHGGHPGCISISQPTELGRVYTLDELRRVGDVARELQLGVHMDGARFGNALVRLGCTPAEMTWKVGVDVLCFGVTKNGGLMGEVVIFFDPERAANFNFIHKRAGQLLSKTRFFAAQVSAYLKDGLWITLARHANALAEKLAAAITANLKSIKISGTLETNELFVTMPKNVAEGLWSQGIEFYEWDISISLYRLVTSWETTEEMITNFIEVAKRFD
jgi:threonine aldolase